MAIIQISTIEQLIAASQNENHGTSNNYLDIQLLNDIDFADYSVENYSWPGFTGLWYANFNGNGHKINNIAYTGTDAWGFFNQLYGSVTNLKLPNMHITSTAHVVGIVENCGACTIQNVHVSGVLESIENHVVALVAHDLDGSALIQECSFSGTVKGLEYANTFTAGKTPTTVYNCSIQGTYEVTSNNGEIYIACMTNTEATNVIFNGIVKGGRNASYHHNWNSTITNCIFVIREGSRGVTTGGGTVNNCYYDSDVATAAGISVQGTGATTAQLQSAQWLAEHNFPT